MPAMMGQFAGRCGVGALGNCGSVVRGRCSLSHQRRFRVAPATWRWVQAGHEAGSIGSRDATRGTGLFPGRMRVGVGRTTRVEASNTNRGQRAENLSKKAVGALSAQRAAIHALDTDSMGRSASPGAVRVSDAVGGEQLGELLVARLSQPRPMVT